jgi:polyisoprenoid-binding protein YceI
MLVITTQNVNAQTYKIVTSKDASIKVLGSSNVHDWTEATSTVESQGEFKISDDSQISGLTAFNLSVSAKSLKSEHEMMDTRTYKAIKADQFPKITFKLESAVITAVQKGKATIKATGDLTIAGVSQSIVLDVAAVVNADNTITCTGSKKIKLTDFKIDPPSYLLGAMKVTNDLTIQYNLTYKK